MTSPAPEASASSSGSENRRIPPWLAIAAVAVFAVLCVGFVVWYVSGSFSTTGGLIPDPARDQRMGGGRQRWGKNPDGVQIRTTPAGIVYFVQSGPSIMEVLPGQDKKHTPEYRFRYNSKDLLTPAQWNLALGLMQLNRDPHWAKTLDITPEQIDRLQKYTYITMEISPADKTTVLAFWSVYLKATSKSDPETKLLAALKEAGDHALPATRVKANLRIADLARIFTTQQMTELTRLGAGQQVTPIPHAATAPSRAASKPSDAG